MASNTKRDKEIEITSTNDIEVKITEDTYLLMLISALPNKIMTRIKR